MGPKTAHAGLLLALAAALPVAAEDYVGTLKPPKGAVEPIGLYSISAITSAGLARSSATDSNFRLKLGYKYSRFLAFEGEFSDFARAPADTFVGTGLVSPFRATAFGVDTVATMPLSHFSFYGRMGAFRGEPRLPFATYSTSLLGYDATRTRWRYGLGVRYDFSNAFGIRAEMEHYSPLGAPLGTEAEADLFSVGLSWRF